MIRALLASFIVAAVVAPDAPGAQAVDGPRFSAVTIKPNASGGSSGGCCMIEACGRVTARNVTVAELLQSAYRRYAFDERAFADLPPWAETARFDIVATAPADPVFDADGFAPELQSMLRNLLADRFKLKLRAENVDRPIYTLTVAETGKSLGPRLRRSDVDCGAVMAKMIQRQPPTTPTCATASYPGRLVVVALSMPAIASLLSQSVGRPVVDRTDLSGRFDLELEAVEIRPPGPFGPSYRPSDTKQSIFASLPEQLGLELKPATAAVEILRVEHVEKPTEG